MPTEIKINYEEVYSKTAELRQRLQSESREAEATYRQASQTLRRMDGKTNAEYTEAIAANQEKSRITAETLTKLIAFIESSARQVERDEAIITRTFTSARIRTRRR